MSVSPSAASRPSAFAPVRAALSAFRASPRALLPALGVCALSYVARQACIYLPTLLSASNPWLQFIAEYVSLILFALADTSAALYVLRVFVRGERPGLASLAEPFRWLSAYPRALFIRLAFPALFFAASLILVLFSSGLGEAQTISLSIALSFVMLAINLLWSASSAVLLAMTRGKCRFRDFFVRPGRSFVSLCAVFLCVDLLYMVVTIALTLPPLPASMTYEQALPLIQAAVQPIQAGPLSPIMLVCGGLNVLLSLPRYAAIAFLYEQN